jgi:hypothetical protein
LTRRDFFGEKITLLDDRDVDAVVSAYDHFLLAVLTKGKSTFGGGNEEGLQIKAAHAAAMAWSELLEIAGRHHIPMAAVVAIGPVLVQADVTYLRCVDKLLQSYSRKAPTCRYCEPSYCTEKQCVFDETRTVPSSWVRSLDATQTR